MYLPQLGSSCRTHIDVNESVHVVYRHFNWVMKEGEILTFLAEQTRKMIAYPNAAAMAINFLSNLIRLTISCLTPLRSGLIRVKIDCLRVAKKKNRLIV